MAVEANSSGSTLQTNCCPFVVSLVEFFLDFTFARHKPEKTAFRAVLELTAPHFDSVAHFDVVALPSGPCEFVGTGAF